MLNTLAVYLLCSLLQEPVVCSGHICQFDDMQVRSVLLDEVMMDPENPTDDLIVTMEIKVKGYDIAVPVLELVWRFKSISVSTHIYTCI